MARKAIVDRATVLQMLKEGKSTRYVADHYGVSRQAIDLHRKDFIEQGLLSNTRAPRKAKAEPSTISVQPDFQPKDISRYPLDQLIDLVIEAFNSLKRIPELESELSKYRTLYENSVHEIESLRQERKKREDQEIRWYMAQHQSAEGNTTLDR